MAKAKSSAEEQTIIEEPIIETPNEFQDSDPGHKTRAYRTEFRKLVDEIQVQPQAETTEPILDGSEPTA